MRQRFWADKDVEKELTDTRLPFPGECIEDRSCRDTPMEINRSVELSNQSKAFPALLAQYAFGQDENRLLGRANEQAAANELRISVYMGAAPVPANAG